MKKDKRKISPAVEEAAEKLAQIIISQIELRKQKEEEQIKKLKSAKTGVPITIDKSYGIIIDGKDTGKRFIRKEDAEEYLKQLKLGKKE